MLNSKFLVKVDNLVKHFPIMRGILYRSSWRGACRGRGIRSKSTKCELWLVGESGCGKSDPDAPAAIVQTASGQRVVRGKDLVKMKSEDLRKTRRKMQMIFQDPYASLNPRMTVGQIVTEPLRIYGMIDRKEMTPEAERLLKLVGLNPAYASRYPHEFSGGQRQRIGIARALALRPTFIVADEPISALDVSIQAQVGLPAGGLAVGDGADLFFIAQICRWYGTSATGWR